MFSLDSARKLVDISSIALEPCRPAHILRRPGASSAPRLCMRWNTREWPLYSLTDSRRGSVHHYSIRQTQPSVMCWAHWLGAPGPFILCGVLLIRADRSTNKLFYDRAAARYPRRWATVLPSTTTTHGRLMVGRDRRNISTET